MKRRGRSFGHTEMNYHLRDIFLEAVKEFDQFDRQMSELELQLKKEKGDANNTVRIGGQIFATSQLRVKAGTMSLISSVALLEQLLYDYATHFFDPESYEMHCENLRFVAKWILIPQLCENKKVDEGSSLIKDLREIVSARNAIIHPKRQVMYDIEKSFRKVEKEKDRFMRACRHLKNTVDSLFKILHGPSDNIEYHI